MISAPMSLPAVPCGQQRDPSAKLSRQPYGPTRMSSRWRAIVRGPRRSGRRHHERCHRLVGQVIGSGLDEAEVVLIEALESVVDGFHWYAESLKIMADNYEDIEAQNAQIVKDVWSG